MTAKEERALLKKQWSEQGMPSVSLTLNVPGYPKSNRLVRLFFDFCLADLRYFLKANRIDLQEQQATDTTDAAGDFFLAPCLTGGADAATVKQLCEAFEMAHPLGRFIDVDWNDEAGNPVSSGKSKLCFFCRRRPAIECRRENTHNQQEVRSFMFAEMARYCLEKREMMLAGRLSALALRALLYEISLTPKPGLVDKWGSGSHADMDYRMFLDSSAAISGWFVELVRAGFAFRDPDYTRALPVIRNIGLRMEAAMFAATGNVNTQKGLVFLMGLSLFALGNLYRDSDRFDAGQFRTFVGQISHDLVRKELGEATTETSHGETIFRRHGFAGARGEAESGFATVFDFGLPQLSGAASLTDETMIRCFLAIASHNGDTNILYRSGPGVLQAFQELCREAAADFSETSYAKVAAFCLRENISPGGSADLLALSLFIHLVAEAEQKEGTIPIPTTHDI